MGDAVVCGQEGFGEGFGGVDAGEVAGFGGGYEELIAGRGVNGEVVDAFVWWWLS